MDIDSLSLEELRQLDQITAAFEKSWNSNSSPRIEDYLEQVNETVRETFLAELIYLDVVYRKRLSESPTTNEYLKRFPNCGEIVQSILNLADTSIGDKSAEATHTYSRALQKKNAAKELLGKQLGRYLVEKCLGEGGEGAVYLALDPTLQRYVAIKVPHETQFSTEESQDRYLQEARTLAKLRHPRIVSILDVGQSDEGKPYIVMEYLEGGSLRDKLKEHKYSLIEIVSLLADVATALHFAHKQGFVHRDLKPSNVLLDKEGLPYLVDFGLALHEELQRKRKGDFSGTISYMAPEQVRGEAHYIDGRADIWACGVMLYEMLTNRRPFESDNASELQEEILKREPKPPRQRDESIPPELEQICLKCLTKDVTFRYTTAIDLATTLQEIAANLEPDVGHGNRRGVRVNARKLRLSPQDAKRKRKRKFLIILLTFALCIGLGAVILSLKTKNGTLIVEINDPNVTVQVLDSEGKIQIERPGEKGTLTIGVDPGKHRLRVVKDGMQVFSQDITIVAGHASEPIKARWDSLKTAAPVAAGNTVVDSGQAEMDKATAKKASGAERSPKTKTQPSPPSPYIGPDGKWNIPPDAPPPAFAPFDAAKAKEHQAAWAKYLGVPLEMENSIGMKFVLIPPGEFDMGSNDADVQTLLKEGEALVDSGEEHFFSRESLRLDSLASETPQHRVAITKPFYLSACEVTRKQYFAMMGDYPRLYNGAIHINYLVPSGVSWDEANAFCGVASERAAEKAKGLVYRLPTEAEWEYACRAGTTTRFNFGDSTKNRKKHAWLYDSLDNHETHAVCQKEPNPWKLYDMHGNAWEWCADWASPDYYENSPRNDPAGPSRGIQRVARGGGCCEQPLTARSATRLFWNPADSNPYLGCRIVVSIPHPAVDLKGERKPGVVPLSATRSNVILGDFEGADFGDWKVEGTAFGPGPARGSLANQPPVSGIVGSGFANSFHDGDISTGKLTSPEFIITHKYITFLVGGGYLPTELAINLLIDGTVVRTATGINGEQLVPMGWDVSDLENKHARIEIVDQAINNWGHISVDQIEMTDEQTAPILPKYIPMPRVVRDKVVADSQGLDYDDGKVKGIPVGSVGVWLDTLDLGKVVQDSGRPQALKSHEGHPLSIGGRMFAHGVGSHATSRWRIDLKESAVKFLAMVGVDDDAFRAGSVCFEVWVDGKKVADSGQMRGWGQAKKLEADLTSAKELLLLITDAGDGSWGDHADWADAIIIFAPSGAKP